MFGELTASGSNLGAFRRRFVQGLQSLRNLEVLDVSGCQIPSTSGIRSLGMSKSLTTLYVGDTPLAMVLSKFSAHLRNLFPHVAVVDGSLRPQTDANAADGEAFEGDSIASVSVSGASPSFTAAVTSGAGSTTNEAGRKRNARHRRRMEALEDQRRAARSRAGSRPGSGAGSQGQAHSERNGALAASMSGADASVRTKRSGRVAQGAEVHTKPKPRERTYAAMHKKRLSSPGSDGAGANISPANMDESTPVAETLGLVPPSARKAPLLTTMATPRSAPQDDDGFDVTILHHSTSRKGGISEYVNFDEDEFGYMDDPFDDEDTASQEYEYRMRSLPWRRPPNPIPRGWLELHVTGHGLQNPTSAGFGEPPPPPPMALTVNGGGFKPVFRGSSFNNRHENKTSGGDGARHLVNNWNVHQVAEKTKAANLNADRARSTPRALAKSARTSMTFAKSPYSDAKHLNNRLWREKKRESAPRYAKGTDTLASTSRTMQTDLGKSDATRSIRRGGVMGSAHDNGSRTRGASVANIYSPRTLSSSPSGFSRRFGAPTVRRSSDETNINTPTSMRSVSRKIGFAGAFRKSAVETAPSVSPRALPEVAPELKTARKILAAAAHSIGGQDFGALLQRVGKGRHGALDTEEFRSMVRQVLNLPPSIVADDEIEGVFQITDFDKKGTIRMHDFISFIFPPDEDALNRIARNEMEVVRDGDQQLLHRQFSPLTIQTTSETTSSYPGRDEMQRPANDGGHLGRVSTDADAISEISHSQSILQGQERVAENVDDEDIMRRWPLSPPNSIGARLSHAGDGASSNIENRMSGPEPSSVEAYYGQVLDHADDTADAGAESNTSILKILQAVIAAKRETIRKLQLQEQSQPPIQRDATSPSTHHTADTTF